MQFGFLDFPDRFESISFHFTISRSSSRAPSDQNSCVVLLQAGGFWSCLAEIRPQKMLVLMNCKSPTNTDLLSGYCPHGSSNPTPASCCDLFLHPIGGSMRCLLFYGRFDSTPSACGPLYQRHLPSTSSSSSSCVGFVPVSRPSCGSFITIPPASLNSNFPPARSNRPTLLVLPAAPY